MEFRILGPLQVLDGETPVEIAGSKRRAVLALLLLHANEVVRTELLIDELWGDHPPRNAPAALHSHVSRLRRALGPDVLARREWGYVLRADPDSIDLHRFGHLVATAEPLPARDRAAKLAEALELWRGPALSDLASEPGLQAEIAHLNELQLATLERRIDADLEAGRNAELVAEIEALIAAHPLREHLRSQLILALYRAGRQAEALEVHRETRRMLTEELGLEPSPELRELEKAILRQDPAIGAVVPLPSPAAEPRRDSRRRGPLLAALLALLLVGLGLGAAFVLAGHGRAHRAGHGVPVAGTKSTPVVATTETTAHETTQALVAKTARKPRHANSTRRQRLPRRTSTKSVVVGSAATHRATRRSAPGATTTTTTTETQAATQKGSGWSLGERGGHLEFAFPPGTAPGGEYSNYGGHVGTLCNFPADFDARVDFTLAQWPPANGISVNLWVFYEPKNYGWAGVWRSSSAQWGEQYGGALESNPGTGVSLNDISGTLRIRRHRGFLTDYFLHNGKWIRVASGYTTARVVITVGASSAQNPPVRDDRVVVDFNNFTVTAANPICPPGAQGSR